MGREKSFGEKLSETVDRLNRRQAKTGDRLRTVLCTLPSAIDKARTLASPLT
jgi:hypothetical protein